MRAGPTPPPRRPQTRQTATARPQWTATARRRPAAPCIWRPAARTARCGCGAPVARRCARWPGIPSAWRGWRFTRCARGSPSRPWRPGRTARRSGALARRAGRPARPITCPARAAPGAVHEEAGLGRSHDTWPPAQPGAQPGAAGRAPGAFRRKARRPVGPCAVGLGRVGFGSG